MSAHFEAALLAAPVAGRQSTNADTMNGRTRTDGQRLKSRRPTDRRGGDGLSSIALSKADERTDADGRTDGRTDWQKKEGT